MFYGFSASLICPESQLAAIRTVKNISFNALWCIVIQNRFYSPDVS